jgi:hypothetical protein
VLLAGCLGRSDASLSPTVPACSCPSPEPSAAPPDLSVANDLSVRDAARPDLAPARDLAGIDLKPLDPLTLYDVVPAVPLVVGRTVQLVGQNFLQPPNHNYVFVSLGGSYAQTMNVTAQSLSFVVPVLPGLADTGVYTDLLVDNGASSDHQRVAVIPAYVSQQGSFEITWHGVTPATLAAGQRTTFDLRVHSLVNRDAATVISVTASQPVTSIVVDGGPTKQVTIKAGDTIDVPVDVTPGPSTTGPFNLYVRATTAGATGFFAVRGLAPGAIATPDFDIDLVPTFVYSARSAVDDVAVVDGNSLTLQLRADLYQAGDYIVDAATSATDWTFVRPPPPSFTVQPAEVAGGKASRSLVAYLHPGSGAAFVTVTVTRSGAASSRAYRWRVVSAD